MRLRSILKKKGYNEAQIRKIMIYASMYNEDKGVDHWIVSVNSILERENRSPLPVALSGYGKDRPPVVSNHSGYSYKGSENFEHDDNGSIMNYSGVEDMMNDATADHEGWEQLGSRDCGL